MKKKLIGRGLIGFPVGIAIGYVITVIISICIGDGFFHPVTPELVNKMGSELNAVLIQTGLSGIMGTGFAMASVIWEIDSWSLAKQSGIYFAIACVIMFPISYFANWMPHSTAGILSYVGIFVAIFLAAWVTQYTVQILLTQCRGLFYAAIIDRRKILYPFSSNNKRVHRKQSAGFIGCAHEIGFRRIDIAQFGKPTAHKGVAGGLYLFVLDKKS